RGADGRLLPRKDFGATDEHARVDAERPADEPEHHDRADAQSAAIADREAAAARETATGIAALIPAVLDIAALRQVVIAHRKNSLTPVVEFRFQSARALAEYRTTTKGPRSYRFPGKSCLVQQGAD